VCGGAELQQQQQQQQGRLLAQQQQQQQMVVVDACCDGSSDDCSSAMEVDGAAALTAAAAAAAAAFKPHPQQQQDWDVSGACSSAASDVFIPEDSETLASSTLSLLPHGQQQQQRFRRIPRSSSASTLSSVQDTGLGFGAGGDNSSSHSSKPLSTEAANAAAAAAAAAAVPAAASLQGVLSLTAAAAAAAGSAAAATVESGAFGALGPRESMEDRHVVVQGLGGDARVTLAAVFDGHRGHEAAAYAAAQLPRNLLLASVLEGSSSSSSNTAVHGASNEQPAADASTGAALALKRSFLATDAAFWQEWQAEMHAHATAGQYTERYPGCTALAAVLAGSQLFVANAGDGRAVLSRGGTAVPLSRQHTADLQDERERVVASGGTVAFRGGSWRVGTAALQVTRALGDFDLKVPAQQPSQQQQQQRYSPYSCNPLSSSSSSVSSSSSTPVTAEPEVVSLQLVSVDQFLILGTDGLWDVIGDQEAVGLVHDTVKDPFLCAKRLVMEALSRGSSDNVSAVVLFLQPKHTLERVWVRGGGAAVPAATPTFYGSRRLTTQQAAEQAGDGAAAAAGPAGAADEMMDTY
jgi:serine/threonine protein phosphatase PrpC